MFKYFVSLEWRAFTRSASFRTNLFMKILMGFGVLYFILVFLSLGGGVYFLLEEMELEPFTMVNNLMIYYVLMDLLVRLGFQKTPVMNIRPLLTLNLRKNSIVSYALGKTLFSFYNWIHWFFFFPFCIVLIIEGFDVWNVVGWFFGMVFLILANNFLNILAGNKTWLMYFLGGLIASLGAMHYYQIFNLGDQTEGLFYSLYQMPWLAIVPLLYLIGLFTITFRFFRRNLYLDVGLAVKTSQASNENLDWLNQFGSLGTFLKNDIKLLLRNKRSKSTLMVSGFFILYGLLFFTGSLEVYDAPAWKIFAGLFVSGGFLFTFGQFVPSWDSSYYPLMMSQNIRYREYLNSKWWLMVIATLVSTIVASFYLIWGWEAYGAVVAAAIFNMGFNSHLVLLAGAYIKTPIDLSSNKNVFGDKSAFNVKTLLITLPKLAVPMGVFLLGNYFFGTLGGYLLVAGVGVIGFAFKNKVFKMTERLYKTQKYETLAAYKQKN